MYSKGIFRRFRDQFEVVCTNRTTGNNTHAAFDFRWWSSSFGEFVRFWCACCTSLMATLNALGCLTCPIVSVALETCLVHKFQVYHASLFTHQNATLPPDPGKELHAGETPRPVCQHGLPGFGRFAGLGTQPDPGHDDRGCAKRNQGGSPTRHESTPLAAGRRWSRWAEFRGCLRSAGNRHDDRSEEDSPAG